MRNGPSLDQVDAAIRAVLADRILPRASVDRSRFDFPGRVLSMRSLEQISLSVREIRIACGTVVTPLARDAIKQRGIAVTLASANGHVASGEWGLATDGESQRFQAYLRPILSSSQVWTTLGASVECVPDWLRKGDRRAAVVLSDRGAWAVWQLHRSAEARAALVADSESLDRSIASLQPNVLVVEPAATSLPEWRHLSSRFRQSSSFTEYGSSCASAK